MKRLFAVSIIIALFVFPAADAQPDDKKWQGVDDTVVGKFAEQAGHKARKPLIFDTDQGDLLLFCFTVGGSIGGFIAGYYFKELFGRPKPEDDKNKDDRPSGSK